MRNYQARNLLRDEIKEGDGVLFYHSSSKPMSVVGTATVVRKSYPDFTAWDPASEHPDPKSTPENPIWYMVDIQAVERFSTPVTLEEMRTVPQLTGMMLLRQGRLSVQPVSEGEWETICRLGAPESV